MLFIYYYFIAFYFINFLVIYYTRYLSIKINIKKKNSNINQKLNTIHTILYFIPVIK